MFWSPRICTGGKLSGHEKVEARTGDGDGRVCGLENERVGPFAMVPRGKRIGLESVAGAAC